MLAHLKSGQETTPEQPFLSLDACIPSIIPISASKRNLFDKIR